MRSFDAEPPVSPGAALGLDPALVARMAELAGEHPVVAAGAALAAGGLALANPELITTLLKAFLDGQASAAAAASAKPKD
jgi:hypothetical protein